jgi:hypothetical protein
VLRVELERASKRLQSFRRPLVIEQRAAEQQQRIHVVEVLLQHVGEAHDSRAHIP